MSQVILKPGRERSIQWRHPWIFSGAVGRADSNVSDGDSVSVHRADGQFLAHGYWCTGGSIAVKLLCFEDRPTDATFWQSALTRAYSLRAQLGLAQNSETTAYRLVNAEGDSLPGLIVDIYNDVAVIQCQTAGMYREREHIVSALRALFGLRLTAIFDKSADFQGANEREEATGLGYLWGQGGNREIREDSHRFLVDWEQGQKTGFFLDQRENRRLIKRYAAGRNVLNAFCYTGGFSVYALAGSANHVVSVDSSRSAIQMLEENIRLNDGADRHQAVTADFLRYMQSFPGEFDLIILDPPAFAKQKSAVKSGLRGYRSINTQALRAIKPGGIVFTFSCSQLVSEADFRTVIFEAALEAKRSVQVLHQLHQAPCHPVSIFHPEGNYLKGCVLHVD